MYYVKRFATRLCSLQVVLGKDQTPEDGEKTAESIMSKLGIEKTDLITGAYIDLLNKTHLPQ